MKRALLLAGVLLASAGWSWAAETPTTQPPKMKPALLIIDVQNAYVPFMAERDRRLALEGINGAIELFRRNGYPVIRIYESDPTWGPKPDTEAFKFHPSLAVKPDDPMIIKQFPSGFRQTELESLLRGKGVNTVFLAGLSATACVLATYHGAAERGFDAFMVRDALLSPEAELTQTIERISETVSYEALRVMLQNAAK